MPGVKNRVKTLASSSTVVVIIVIYNWGTGYWVSRSVIQNSVILLASLVLGATAIHWNLVISFLHLCL